MIPGVNLGVRPGVREIVEVAGRPCMADDSLRSMSDLFPRSVKTSRTERLSLRYTSSLVRISNKHSDKLKTIKWVLTQHHGKEMTYRLCWLSVRMACRRLELK